jgi:hypothetical protein
MEAYALTNGAEEVRDQKECQDLRIERDEEHAEASQVHQHLRHQGLPSKLLPCERQGNLILIGALHKALLPLGPANGINLSPSEAR